METLYEGEVAPVTSRLFNIKDDAFKNTLIGFLEAKDKYESEDIELDGFTLDILYRRHLDENYGIVKNASDGFIPLCDTQTSLMIETNNPIKAIALSALKLKMPEKLQMSMIDLLELDICLFEVLKDVVIAHNEFEVKLATELEETREKERLAREAANKPQV